MRTRGRFAPSPTGPLHLGSLLAAVGSWLFARRHGGEWLVRFEDLDAPRIVAGAESDILRALERYALHWDGAVVRQSERIHLYENALDRLRSAGRAYDCGCSRAEIARAASAPALSDPVDTGGPIYPGTCRDGLASDRQARAIRFRVARGVVHFEDIIAGPIAQDVSAVVGDFVVRRADGPFAYQLAVVVDDAEQQISEVVRGADLLDSTARQIQLQRALGYRTPAYAHLPLIVGPNGSKLGKRDGSLPVDTLDPDRVARSLQTVLAMLGVGVERDTPDGMLAAALSDFDSRKITLDSIVLSDPVS